MCFIQKNDRSFFFSNHSGSTKTFSETDINMLEFLIDNIFVMFGGCVFQQRVCMPMGTICTTRLAEKRKEASTIL